MIATHFDDLIGAVRRTSGHIGQVRSWGGHLADVLTGGGRLLACGNGGSAAEAQHLTAELVGRFKEERQPLSAIALHADTSALTAVVNDYGGDEIFSRGVRAHGRPNDVLVALSTSGTSHNVLTAARPLPSVLDVDHRHGRLGAESGCAAVDVDVEQRVADDHQRGHEGTGPRIRSSTAMHSAWTSSRCTS